MYPPALPIGTLFTSRVYGGAVVPTAYVGTLTYQWGAKGQFGSEPKAYYCIPVLGGLVCEWVATDLIIGLGECS